MPGIHPAHSADGVHTAVEHPRLPGGSPRAPSRLHHLKELRPASTGETEVRILFIFDPARQMVLLVAGDKSRNWRSWYEVAIPLAETRYTEHLATVNDEDE
jgi:hypothetical protein